MAILYVMLGFGVGIACTVWLMETLTDARANSSGDPLRVGR